MQRGAGGQRELRPRRDVVIVVVVFPVVRQQYLRARRREHVHCGIHLEPVDHGRGHVRVLVAQDHARDLFRRDNLRHARFHLFEKAAIARVDEDGLVAVVDQVGIAAKRRDLGDAEP